jgi:ligand-binding sensor domain-containing protein
MKQIPILWLPFAVLFFTSCSGSATPAVPESGVASRVPKPKLTRTQGSDQFAEVRCGLQDQAGNLWFGTRNQGVWRYDGKTFSRYTKQPGLGMPLLVDRSGNIWFSGQEHENGFENKTGIWRYDGKTFRNFSTKEGLGNFGVWCMVEDRHGNIWVGTRNTGLYRYDGKSFTRFSDKSGLQ